MSRTVPVRLGSYSADVIAPDSWSDNAVGIAASKYMIPGKEYGVAELLSRVSAAIVDGAVTYGQVQDGNDSDDLRERVYLALRKQRYAWNTPVWMNIGVPGRSQQAWACTEASTRMLTANGLCTIKSLTSPTDIYTTGGWSPGFSWRTGIKNVVRVLLSNGMEIVTTPDHRFVVGDELREAYELEGMKLTPMLGAGDWESGDDRGLLETDLVRLGFMQGDGTYPTPNSILICIGEKDGDVAPLFADGVIRSKRGRFFGVYHPLVEQAQRLGMLPAPLPFREMPEGVYTLTPKGMSAWLRGLFSANGTIDSQSTIMLKGTNLALAKGVQRCLLALGMSATLRTRPKQEIEWKNGTFTSRESYEVRIVDRASREVFSRCIGFQQEYKSARLAAHLAKEVPATYPRTRHLPTVVSVDPIGETEVYDFNVQDPSHVAWANGFAIHNCLILDVQDDMESIKAGWAVEATTFQGGSGSGVNVSRIRANGEPLRGGGKGSGPISLWIRPTDAIAGVVKSGGRTRRAAKMIIMDVDHPEILDFVETKAKAERIARTLLQQGYDVTLNGEDSAAVPYQNANHSVRVTDAFMRAVRDGRPWNTTYRTTGEVAATLDSRTLWKAIARAAWECGDPGIQFHDTTNAMNSCLGDGEIVASNPCVTGDTLVATIEGPIPIRDLVGKVIEVVGLNGELYSVTDVFPTSTKQVYLLRTKSGFQIKVTVDHRIWTINRGDVPAQELTKEDVLSLGAVRLGRGELAPAVARYVGLMLGDGCISGSAQLTMAHSERNILEAVLPTVNAFTRQTHPNGVNVTVRDTSCALVTGADSVLKMLRTYAVLDAGSDGKKLTQQGMALNRESMAALLQGLFTADGTVANIGKKSQYVSLDSTSPELLEQVQILLLGFGIKARLYRNRRLAGTTSARLPDGKGGRKDYPVKQMHSLRIARAGRVLFEKEIGFMSESPKAGLLARLNQMVGGYADPLIDRFHSLTPLREEDVYDLTEPVTSHFVANGLVVHNCSEYLWLNNTVCNLASIRLTSYLGGMPGARTFDTKSLIADVEDLVVTMDALVDISSYPTEEIGDTSKRYRTLGIGFTDLGALLMSLGLAYDSDEGRNLASAISSLIQAAAVRKSQELAMRLGAYPAWEANKEHQERVLEKHDFFNYELQYSGDLELTNRVWDAASDEWKEIQSDAPMRNAQLTVIAPTGTISFLMDCETTGIEPVLAIEATKDLVGGGSLDVGVSRCVQEGVAEIRLTFPDLEGLSDEEIIKRFPTVFQTALGDNPVSPEGHVRMMAAVQPFISGGISKTVNLPATATVEDVENIYLLAWRTGCKAIAIFRDGCKAFQPVNVPKSEQAMREERYVRQERRKPPSTREGLTHKFQIQDQEYYLTVNRYPDGTPCEIFVKGSQYGSGQAGWVDAFSIAVSYVAQGGSLEDLLDKLAHMQFSPAGFVAGEGPIHIASSPVDYLARWIQQVALGSPTETKAEPRVVQPIPTYSEASCGACGAFALRRAGSCMVCGSCGETSGCS